jgi:methyl-accepting chemotaxis protein-1 (serine sensor receptor)
VFSRLNISTKLLVLIGVLLAAMLLVGAYGMHALGTQQARAATALSREHQLAAATSAADRVAVNFKLQVQEWKDLLLRGQDRTDYENYLAAFRKRSASMQEDLKSLGNAMAALNLPTTNVEEARRLHSDLTAQYEQALRQFDASSIESSHVVDRQVRGKDRPLDTTLREISATLQELADHERGAITASAAEDARQASLLMTAVMGIAFAGAIAFGLWLAAGITRPLREAVLASRRVAQGDLTIELRTSSRDELGQLLEAFSTMASNLRLLVGELAAGAHAVADSSAQIAQGNLDLSQRTEEQASTLEETASQMEELTTTVTQNAHNARQASEVAAQAAEVARRGGAAVTEVVQTMDGISTSSRRISEIIGVIDGIAFQTNILALNAAVEAARAGEQGRGFAVVAAEVRNLAQRSAAAAKEIKGLISESVAQVGAGAHQVGSAGRSVQDIVVAVNRVSELVAEIAAASQEQSAGIEQVNTAVTQMDQVVQQNASLVEEATAATESMKVQAGTLLQLVSRFRLHSDAAEPAHRHQAQPVAPIGALFAPASP